MQRQKGSFCLVASAAWQGKPRFHKPDNLCYPHRMPTDLRIAVVGTSCSGKTTLARRLAHLTGLPHIELDRLHWLANWTPKPLPEFRAAVSEHVAAPQWVLDGNYSKVRDIVWSRAVHLVWLNLPFPVVMWRALTRTARRIVTREELYSGNRENLKTALFEPDSIIWWVIKTHKRRQREYRALIDQQIYPHLIVHEVRQPQVDLPALLRAVQEPG